MEPFHKKLRKELLSIDRGKNPEFKSTLNDYQRLMQGAGVDLSPEFPARINYISEWLKKHEEKHSLDEIIEGFKKAEKLKLNSSWTLPDTLQTMGANGNEKYIDFVASHIKNRDIRKVAVLSLTYFNHPRAEKHLKKFLESQKKRKRPDTQTIELLEKVAREDRRTGLLKQIKKLKRI